MPERAQESTALEMCQVENVIPGPNSQLDVSRNNK